MVLVNTEKLKQEIHKRGLSFSAFAKKCNKSKSSLYNVLKRQKISASYAIVICNLLEKDFDYFFKSA